MKVERQKAKPTFDPIVITLETEEEANHLWHKFNCNTNWSDYCHSRDIYGRVADPIPAWKALNEVFHPTNDC